MSAQGIVVRRPGMSAHAGQARARRQDMRVMVLGKANPDNNGAAPTREAFAAMDRFIEDLVKAGVMVAGAGLKSDADAKRISITADRQSVIDGPFAETRELVAGF